jgi:hypothetical protein
MTEMNKSQVASIMKTITKILFLVASGQLMAIAESSIHVGIVYEFEKELLTDNVEFVEKLRSKSICGFDKDETQSRDLCFYELQTTKQRSKVLSCSLTRSPTGDGGFDGEAVSLVLESPYPSVPESFSLLGVVVSSIDCNVEARVERIISKNELHRLINIDVNNADQNLEKIVNLANIKLNLRIEITGQQVVLEIETIKDTRRFYFVTPIARQSNLVVAQTEPDSDLDGSDADFWIIEFGSPSTHLLLVRHMVSTLWLVDVKAQELRLLERFYKGP